MAVSDLDTDAVDHKGEHAGIRREGPPVGAGVLQLQGLSGTEWRCCQSNDNSSPVWRNLPNPSLASAHDRAPLGQGG
jgi:hypothetical protein